MLPSILVLLLAHAAEIEKKIVVNSAGNIAA